MNEQEKALQGVLEFCQWLIPNAKQLGLEKSKSIVAISQAKTQEDIINGVNSLYQELGEEQFTALTQAFEQSKAQNIKMAKNGTKINYLVDKLQKGNKLNSTGPKKTDVLQFKDPKYNAFYTVDGHLVEEVNEDGAPIYYRYGRWIKNPGTPKADTVYSFRNFPFEYQEGFDENGKKIIKGSLEGINRNWLIEQINRNIDFYKQNPNTKKEVR